MGNSGYERIVKEYIHQRDEQIVNFMPQLEQVVRQSGLAAQRVEQITRMTVEDLVRLLNKGIVTSEQLVAIFGIRAGTVGRHICAITEDNFEEAIQLARKCDDYRRESGKRNWTLDEEWNSDIHLCPLYGIPISIKENVDIKGLRSTWGAAERISNISQKDAPLVTCLKNSGMIPFIKTNIPQLAMCFDTYNRIYGRSLNPWNTQRTAGGSSGGQSAAIAARVSPVGIGNDMAGSIRIPSHFCGLSGLMTSPRRWPKMSNMAFFSTPIAGKDFLTGVNGPMSKSIETLAMLTHIATSQELYEGRNDPYIKLFPFDFKEYQAYQKPDKKIKVGYIESLQLIQCVPACKRALRQSVDFLRKQGYQLIQVKIPNEKGLIQALVGEMTAEGGLKAFKACLGRQPVIPEYKKNELITSLPRWVQNIAAWALKFGKPRIAMYAEAAKTRSVYEYLQMTGRSYQLKEEFIQYWKNLELDFIVLPGFATAAPKHKGSIQGSLLASYTFIWNVLGMCACTLPATVVREEEQYYDTKWNDEISSLIKEDMEGSAGMPVGVQVVGMPFSEEKVLGVAKQLEGHFKFNEKHPLPNI